MVEPPVGEPEHTLAEQMRGLGVDLPGLRSALFGGVRLFGVPAPEDWVAGAPNAVNWIGDAAHYYLTAADHAAVWTSWRDRFGVEVLHLDRSSVEFIVHQPPAIPAEVAEVTAEQWAYCPDLVQVFGEPEWVACEQVPARRWYFWWD